jgi:hypothetical protein
MQRPRGITPLQGIITIIIARNFSRKVAGQERDLPRAEQSDLLEVPRSARQNTVVI